MLQLQEVKDIKEEWLTLWCADDFQTKLHYNDNRTAIPPYTKDSVWNDNGALFTVTMLQLLSFWDQHHSLNERFIYMVINLRWDGELGVYTVNPGREDNNNSHDNYVALAAGSALYDLTFAKETAQKGFETGWRFDHNVFIQPKDQCFIKMCAGISPGIFEYVHMLGAFVWACFYPLGKSSEILLTWVRANGLYDAAHNKFRRGELSSLWRVAGAFAVVWSGIIEWRFGSWEKVFSEYYKEREHPARQLSKGI